jgi:hypothetical protein
LSPAPQALPQAAGASEGAAAPQAAGASVGAAAPQAAGASAGLSEEPQAEPQAEAGAVFVSLFHPERLESAISIDLRFVLFSGLFPVCKFIIHLFSDLASTHFFIWYLLFCNYLRNKMD